MTDRETATEIDAAAMRWAVRGDTAPLDERAQAALDAWLAGDVRRLGAYARARAGIVHAGRAQALGTGFDADAYQRRHAAAPGSFLDRTARRRTVLRRGIGVAAGAGATVALGFGWQAAAATTFTTARGEVRLIPLTGGSTMTLNTDTRARVRYGQECAVELIQGEAMFDVAVTDGKPFVVTARDAAVSTRGGMLTVTNLAGRSVTVVVERGVVDLGDDALRPAGRAIGPNSRATFAADRPIAIAPLRAGEIARALAWREGKLSFEDVPLRAAAAEFGRYSDTQIVFADPAIADNTVTGLFSANNPAGFARSAALSLGLEAQERPGAIELRARAKKI